MEDTKSFLASKTFWGGLIAVLAGFAGLIGFDPAQLPSADEIVAVIGGVIAIVGRFTATKAITVV